MAVILLALGVVVLYAGGELLVASAVKLARSLGLSPLVIGLTVVAFATSCPELFATSVAAFKGAPAVSLGNVFGSNIANLGLILGLSALWRPLAGSARFLRREVVLLVGVAVVPFPLLADGSLGRIEGLVLLGLLGMYLFFLLQDGESRKVEDEYAQEYGGSGRGNPWLASLGVLAGLLLLTGGAHLLVEGAVSLARALGITERVIGLTLVAFGTSLPELASSLAAARRREGDIVLGNVVGSNIFNVLCVLGLTSLMRPIPGHLGEVAFDLWVGLAFSVAVLPMLLLGRRLYLGRWEGLILVVGYVVYVRSLF